MKPPYPITPKILAAISSISEKVGAIKAAHLQYPRAELRKMNRIKTIHSSLQIEGNTLTIQQVTALLENKRVMAPEKDIREVKNAIVVYNQLEKLNSISILSFLKAHALLMKGLVSMAGKIRTTSVGIIKGTKLAHLAPSAKMVRPLLNDLFEYLKSNDDPVLIKSCVFHYELEFIHPFADGNGRMGRLWQTVLLRQYNPVFAFLPVEIIIKNRQSEYYKALSIADKSGHSTKFIEFMLSVLDDALDQLLSIQQPSISGADRIGIYKSIIGDAYFSRKDYLRNFKEVSPATASRDLKLAIEKKVLTKQGDKRTTRYKYS